MSLREAELSNDNVTLQSKVEELQIKLGMQHQFYLLAMDRAEKAEAVVTELVALLRRARAVIPQEYEDEIEVRTSINFHLNLNDL